MKYFHNEWADLKRAILFNGPPGSGKTTAARMLQDSLAERYKKEGIAAGALRQDEHISFSVYVDNLKEDLFPVLHLAEPLKSLAHGLYNTPLQNYEDCKDNRSKDFGGLTPRQAYIKTSTAIKKTLGDKVFADSLLRKTYGKENIIVADLGFAPELAVFVEKVPQVVVLRMHRKDKDFKNDSRSYLEHERSFDAHNNGSLESLRELMNIIAETI